MYQAVLMAIALTYKVLRLAQQQHQQQALPARNQHHVLQFK
jgi:hypothetical protein